MHVELQAIGQALVRRATNARAHTRRFRNGRSALRTAGRLVRAGAAETRRRGAGALGRRPRR